MLGHFLCFSYAWTKSSHVYDCSLSKNVVLLAQSVLTKLRLKNSFMGLKIIKIGLILCKRNYLNKMYPDIDRKWHFMVKICEYLNFIHRPNWFHLCRSQSRGYGRAKFIWLVYYSAPNGERFHKSSRFCKSLFLP